MCGIFFSLSHHGFIAPDDNTAKLLRHRGPDRTGLHQLVTLPQKDVGQLHATFLSTVLSLRGTEVVSQPLIDEETGSVLCWNGEAWSIHGETVAGNDSEVVFDLILKACASNGSPSDGISAVVRLLSNIRGPYAIVFYDAVNKRIVYGRDCLGRRSLLKKPTADGTIVLSSVCDNVKGEAWTEVEADGIYVVNLHNTILSQNLLCNVTHVPHTRRGGTAGPDLSFVGKYFQSRGLLISAGFAISTHERRSAGS